MTLLRCILECTKLQRTVVLCADAGSSFLSVCLDNGAVVSATIVEDLSLALGQASSYLLADMNVEEIAQWFEEAKPIRSVKSCVEARPDRSALLSFEAHDKLLFRKNYDEFIDAHMMQDAFGAALSGWHLVRPARKIIVKAALLLERSSDSHRVRLLRVLPENAENQLNLLVEIYAGETPILARFGPLVRALHLGNAFVHPDKKLVYRQREDIGYFGPELRLEIVPPRERDPDSARKPLFEYTKREVRTAVLPLGDAPGSGYQIEIFVDDRFIDVLKHDVDRGNQPLQLPRAIREAQELLDGLQGWRTLSDPH